MGLTLILNGQTRSFDGMTAKATVASLVELLGLKADRIALEVNGQIVPRGTWREMQLVQGDRIELVHFVGGGTGVR